MDDFEVVNKYGFYGIKTPVDLNYLYKEGMTFEELNDVVLGDIKRHAIMEGDDCVKFLEDFDPSFRRSLRLAYEMGATVLEIDSYLLAKLRLQEMLNEGWEFVKNGVKEVINNELKKERNESI